MRSAFGVPPEEPHPTAITRPVAAGTPRNLPHDPRTDRDNRHATSWPIGSTTQSDRLPQSVILLSSGHRGLTCRMTSRRVVLSNCAGPYGADFDDRGPTRVAGPE